MADNPFMQFVPPKENPFAQFIPAKKEAPPPPAQPDASPGVFDPRSVKAALQGAVTPEQRKLVQALTTYPAHAAEGLLNIPKAAFEASEEYRKGGEYNAAPIVDAALLGVGPSVAGRRPIPTAAEAPKPVEAAPAPVAPQPAPSGPPGAEPRVNEFGGVSKDTFNYPIKDAAGGKVGEIEYVTGTRDNPDAKAITIRAAGIHDPSARGKGLGTEAYKKLIDWAHEQGLEVHSSGSTNDLSEAVYERLRKQGYNVTKNGDTFEIAPKAEPARKYTQGDLLEAQQVYREAVWRTRQGENNPAHERFAAQAKAKLDEIEASLNRPEAPKASGPPGGGPPPEAPNPFDQFKPATPIKDQAVNLSDDLQRIKQSGVADRAEIGNRIAAAPKEILDKDLQEKFYHAIEDPKKMAELTPQERALFDQHVQPLRDEAKQLYNKIKNLGGEKMVDDPTYVHRIAKGHAPQYDTLSGESSNPIAGTRSLNKKTSALQERKFYAIENAEGKRFVVSRDADGGVSVWKDGKPTKIKQEADLQPGRGMEIGGQDWEIKQARTSEIEANSSARYYKNAMLNTADSVVRMREVARNLEFLEKTKTSPWWLENAMRIGGDKRIPAGWRQPKIPQLHDWYVNPKLANVLDDFYKPGVFDADSAIRKINQFATGSIFWNPIPHIENVGAHWFTGRGWDWIRPGPVRHFSTDAGRAIQAVVTQNKLYQDFLREGSGLVYGGVKNADFYQAMGKKFGMEIEKNWGAWQPIAKKLKINKPGEFIAWWYDKTRNVLWAANDMFMMHRYLELERKGMPRAKAIKEAEKHIPNYRIPPEVLGSRTFSQILQEPGLTIFSRYHYGMWKSYMNMVADLAKGSTKEKVDALGNMAALGVLMYAIYPAIDYALQKLTGDPKAEKLRRGSASIPEWATELYEGDLTFPQFLSNTITLAPVTREAVSLSNFWDRRPDVQRLDDLAKTAVSPYSTARQFMDERSGGNSPGRSALNIVVGAKNTSERTERGKQIAKSIRDKQTRKYIDRLKKDVGGAVDKVKSVFGGTVE